MIIERFDPTTGPTGQPLDCLSLLIPKSFQTPLWLIVHRFNLYVCSCFTRVLTTWTNSSTTSLLIPFKQDFTYVKCSSWQNHRTQQKHTLRSTENQQKYLQIADDYRRTQNSLCRSAFCSTWNELPEFKCYLIGWAHEARDNEK